MKAGNWEDLSAPACSLAIQQARGSCILPFDARKTVMLLFAMCLLVPCPIALGLQRQLSPLAEESFVSGTNAMKHGNYQASINAFQKVVELERNFAPAYQNIGLAYFAQKDYPKAITWFNQALKLDDKLQGARLFLGISYVKIGASSQAIKPLLGVLALGSHDPQVYVWLGRAYFAEEKYTLAVPYLEKAQKAFPGNLSIEYTLGRAYELLAQELFEDIYRKNPQSPFTPYFLGKTFVDEGRLNLAIVEFRRVLTIDPNFEKAHEALADIYEKEHKDSQAVAELKAELEIDPNDLIAKCKLAALLIDEGRPEKAIPLMREAAHINPSLFCTQYELGNALLRIGTPSEAVVYLRAATVIDPSNESAHYSLGQAYRKLGKPTQASAEFQRLLLLQQKKEQRVKQSFDGAAPH